MSEKAAHSEKTARFDEDTLKTLEDCGAAEMPSAETCAIAEIGETDFWASPEAQRRYRIGQLRTKLEMRQAIIKIAKSGNPAMVKVYQDFAAENAVDAPPARGQDGESGGEFEGI